MTGFWFKEDIKRKLAERRFVVVTDANGDCEYQLTNVGDNVGGRVGDNVGSSKNY